MIKYMFSSLKKDIAKITIVFLLSVVSFYLLLSVYCNSYAFEIQMSLVSDFFDSVDEVYKIDVSSIENFEKSGQYLAELKRYAREELALQCGSYDESGEYFKELENETKYMKMNKKYYKGTYREETPDISEVIFVDKNMTDIANFSLPDVAEQENALPVYVGSDFKQILSVGKQLTLLRNGEKYFVAGYLDNVSWLNDSDPVTMPPENLNHKFVTLFSKSDQTDTITQQSTVGKIFVKCPKTYKAKMNLFVHKALDLGIKIRMETIGQTMKSWTKENESILLMNKKQATIMTVCSVLSIISTLCVSIILDRKEYGIRIAFGISKKEALISLWMKEGVVMITAGGLSILLKFWDFFKQRDLVYYPIYIKSLLHSVPGLVSLIILFLVAAVAVPSVLLYKLSPAELVKEVD